ncbi:MAG: DUF4268 domain-containing protein [Thiolinea sp.]
MSDTQYSEPLKISSDRCHTEVLTRCPIATNQEGNFNESFIQNLVFDHPSSLPIDQIDRSFTPIIPVCQELRTPAGPLDVLYITPEGRLVILEAKLWRNPEARRKVVAQILDYAKELRRWDYEDLQREVSRKTGEKGNSLYRLASAQSNISEADFVDEINRTLASGRFLLLIVGDGIREGAAAITDFLTDVGNMEFTFGLVELAIYQSRNNELLVQPRVLAKTVIIQRTVVTLRDNKLELLSDAQDDGSSNDYRGETEREWKEHEIYYSQFWPEFIDELQLDDTSQPIPPHKPGRRGNIFFGMPPGSGTAWITVYFDQQSQEVGVFLRFRKGEFAELAYHKLLQDQAEIDAELGIDVEWSSVNGKNSITAVKYYNDLFSPENREDIKAFFSDTVNRFVNVFRPRLQRIVDDM